LTILAPQWNLKNASVFGGFAGFWFGELKLLPDSLSIIHAVQSAIPLSATQAVPRLGFASWLGVFEARKRLIILLLACVGIECLRIVGREMGKGDLESGGARRSRLRQTIGTGGGEMRECHG
jgi:hypothetical protein